MHFKTHTNTNTHYTASSSIQAPLGCPANPALVVHALERWRLCCSILLVRDNQHNTQQKHFTSLCPGVRKKSPFPKNPPRPYKTMKFKRLRFQSNGATNYTLARKQPARWCILGHTHTNTNTHYTASSSIEAPFGCPANSALVVHALERLRLCCSILLVRDKQIAFGTTNTTHTKHVSLCCALGCGKKNPFPRNPPRS